MSVPEEEPAILFSLFPEEEPEPFEEPELFEEPEPLELPEPFDEPELFELPEPFDEPELFEDSDVVVSSTAEVVSIFSSATLLPVAASGFLSKPALS